jgi:hypothetical protein
VNVQQASLGVSREILSKFNLILLFALSPPSQLRPPIASADFRRRAALPTTYHT